MQPSGLQVERTVVVRAAPDRILAAFFDPADLARWWKVARSVTVARPLGTYAVEWLPSEIHDELLGGLGGAFHGTVMDFRTGREFFVADAYWNPPSGEPIGPMALEVRCSPEGTEGATRVVVRQSAEDEGPRWQRYFHIVAAGWQVALDDLKAYLEGEMVRTR